MLRRFVLVTTCLAACSDYNFTPEKEDPKGGEDSTPGWDSGDSGSPPVDACEDPTEPAGHAVAINNECEVEYQEGSFTPVVEFHYGNTAFCGPPAVGQTIDTNSSGGIDSGDLPVILIYQGGAVEAIWGDGSGVAWRAAGNFGQDGGFAIGDVNRDGWPDVVTASNNTICALDGRNGSQLWCTGGLGSSLDPLGYSYPSIADMDGDGTVEVTAGSAILDGPTGNVVGRGNSGIGAAPYGGSPGSSYGALSVPVDLDGDGQLELVTGNAAYDRTGARVWSNTGLDGLVAVADFDGDGQGEIVKTSGIYITGMESDGREVWGPKAYSGNVSAPAIDDLDGDGVPEIVFAAQGKLMALEWGGAEIWGADIADYSGAAGPTLFDFEMDGYPEVLYADETSIRFFSGLDGSVKYQSNEHQSYTILETPIVADVDNDDQVEIVLGHCSWNRSVSVYGDADRSWPPGRKVWNQHAYYITNVDDVGQVPSPTTSNFSLYNSFRSGDVGRPPSEYWDLKAEVLDVCEDECDTGKFYVAAWPMNAGNIEVPAGTWLSLRAGASGPILDAQRTADAIAPGFTGDMVVFEVPASQIAGYQPVVTADEDGTGQGQFYECDEGNNAETWAETVCD
jgi:hypothetical protein